MTLLLLQSVLSQQYDKHPIIILKDVKYAELRAMMDYMYRGEVNISQDQLAALLKAAESLQIKGLSDNKPSRPPSRPAQPPVAHPPRAPSPPPQVNILFIYSLLFMHIYNWMCFIISLYASSAAHRSPSIFLLDLIEYLYYTSNINDPIHI